MQSEIVINGITFSHHDIGRVVDNFYSQVQKDPLLQIPFSSVQDWPEHIRRLTHFWWVRFGGESYAPYTYNPVLKHFHAGFNDQLLEQWLNLFRSTLISCLTPEQAAIWQSVSERMGESLSIRNEALKSKS